MRAEPANLADAAPLAAADLVRVERHGPGAHVVGSGEWTAMHAGTIDAALAGAGDLSGGPLVFDTRGVTRMDTTGAWFVQRARAATEAAGQQFRHLAAGGEQEGLVAALAGSEAAPNPRPRGFALAAAIDRGLRTAFKDAHLALYVLGAAIRGPQSKAGGGRWRVTSIVNQLDQMALRAVPVVALMTFLVGGIIAQQAAFQLRYYGEELLTASMSGLLILREVGVLLAAILVAGRTGSAITAEFGTMKMREETDALTVMGLSPVGVLIFPRLVALVIALPLLTIVANAAGVMGAMVMCAIYVDLPPPLFLEAFRDFIDHTTVGAGMIKAPFMALIIGIVAAVEGLKVQGSAESLGRRVTASVVKSIFLVIVVDGFFAIFYAAIDY